MVHMSSGYAALIGALFLGPSLKDSSGAPREPANVPYVILGTALLWFGWFGFNAGSGESRVWMDMLMQEQQIIF